MTQPKITMYSTASCGFCKMLKGYLTDKGLEYDVKMVDEDQSLAKELYEKSGQLGVPFTVVENDGKEEAVLGFDKRRFDEILA